MLIDGITGLADHPPAIVVVGAGPVGLALATDLARRNVPVVLLESGGPGPNEHVQSLSHAHLVNPARHDDMSIAVSRQLGGSSNLWGGRCLPYDPIDFAPRPFVDARWPIDYATLTPYWDRAVEATRSGAPRYDAPAPLVPDADGTFSADTLERWANIQAAQVVHANSIRKNPHLRVHTHATLVGVNLGENGHVRSIDVGHSLTGERVTMPVSRLVICGGGLETTRQLLVMQQKSAELFGGTDGPLGRFYMGHLIGEVADIVFSSGEIARQFDYWVDDHGSYVRRRIVPSPVAQMEHRLLNCAFWPVVPPVADPRHRSAILSSVYLALSVEPIGKRLVAEAIRRRHIPDKPAGRLQHVRNVLFGLPSVIGFTANFFRRRYDRKTRLPGFFVRNDANRFGLSFHSEQAPCADSRVWLSGECDRLGMPSLAVDLRFSEQDVDSVVRTHDLLERWLADSGLGHLDYRTSRERRGEAILAQASHGTHQIGTTRMAASRNEGIVDADLRSFDIPNLYLASTSVLPTSGQANPTLTTIALALRLADRLFAETQSASALVATGGA